MKFLICFSLTLSLFVSIIDGFACGSGRFQPFLAGYAIATTCPTKLGKFNACCKTHDRCYDAQKGQASCDNTFCACLKRAATGAWSEKCQTYAATFCALVKSQGHKAYNG